MLLRLKSWAISHFEITESSEFDREWATWGRLEDDFMDNIVPPGQIVVFLVGEQTSGPGGLAGVTEAGSKDREKCSRKDFSIV